MLKNLEKLNGFYISPMTPIEYIYSCGKQLCGYSFLLERKNYPFVMYGKFDINFDLVEFYPWKLGKFSDAKSVDIVTKNIKLKNISQISQPNVYFSVNAKTLKIEDFYTNIGYLKKFNYMTKNVVHNYFEYTSTNIGTLDKYGTCFGEDFMDFIKPFKPSYGFLYLDPMTNKATKALVAYAFATEAHYQEYEKLKLNEIIQASIDIASQC